MTREQRAAEKKMDKFMNGAGAGKFTDDHQLDEVKKFLCCIDDDMTIDDEFAGFDNQNQNSDLGSAFRELKNMGMEFS